MKKAAIIFGGVSPEHAVSIKSASNIYKAGATSTRYTFSLIGVSKNGAWYLMPADYFESNSAIGSHASHQLLQMQPGSQNPFSLAHSNVAIEIDVVFPIIHGNNGEDGLLQGLLEMCNVAFAGPPALASAACMDKDITKQLLAANGIPVTPGVCLYSHKPYNASDLVVQFGLPLFVKPANMGSGVGVFKCNTLLELNENIKKAFAFDFKILVEKAIVGREVETAVLGNNDLEVSTVGEIIVSNGFYTYENKYINPETVVNVPAKDFDSEQATKLCQTALKAFEVMQLKGLSRIDFFYINENEYYLNEINTLPGFTDISMYPKLMETVGYGYTQLIEKLLDLGIELSQAKQKLIRDI